jgi:hypothetical protein
MKLNRTECVALAELLRRSDDDGAQISALAYADGDRAIEVVVGEIASTIRLQQKGTT